MGRMRWQSYPATQGELLGQLVDQRPGVPQDRRVEAFGEPAIDRRKKVTGFAALALFAPEARKAD